jgi:hypothetical protein
MELHHLPESVKLFLRGRLACGLTLGLPLGLTILMAALSYRYIEIPQNKESLCGHRLHPSTARLPIVSILPCSWILPFTPSG